MTMDWTEPKEQTGPLLLCNRSGILGTQVICSFLRGKCPIITLFVLFVFYKFRKPTKLVSMWREIVCKTVFRIICIRHRCMIYKINAIMLMVFYNRTKYRMNLQTSLKNSVSLAVISRFFIAGLMSVNLSQMEKSSSIFSITFLMSSSYNSWWWWNLWCKLTISATVDIVSKSGRGSIYV